MLRKQIESIGACERNTPESKIGQITKAFNEKNYPEWKVLCEELLAKGKEALVNNETIEGVLDTKNF